jgi:hypothetical protein
MQNRNHQPPSFGHLFLIIPTLTLTFDAHQFRLPLIIHHHGRQPASRRTPRIQPLGPLLDIQSPLPVMTIYNRRALLMLQLLLLMVPECLPGGSVVGRRRDARLQVNSAHIHNVHGILLFEGCVGDEAGVHGDEVAEVGDVPDA